MLTSLRLENFKSFADQRVELGPVTLLVGANASGKSNFLEALRFLQGLARGLTVEEALDGAGDAWPGIRGGARECCFRGGEAFSITSEWRVEGMAFQYRLACTGPAWRMLTEELCAGGESGQMRLIFRQETKVSRKHSPRTSLAARSFTEGLTDREAPAVLTAIQGLTRELESLAFLDLRPDRMREYAPTGKQEMGEHGEFVWSVLHRLTRAPEERAALVDWVSDFCAPELVDLHFTETDLGDVMAAGIERDGTRVSARAMSDGTLRFLGLIAALRYAPNVALQMMEDIETGLHPARLGVLAQLLELRRQEATSQVIATTHSAPLLGALSPEILRDAVVFARTPDSPGTLMRRLGDLPHYEEVVARRGIEHLFTTQWLERAL